jgi:hypothetical protein
MTVIATMARYGEHSYLSTGLLPTTNEENLGPSSSP